MKKLLLAGTALLELAASEPAAHAQRFEFDYTVSLVTFSVPIKGTYQIIAFGAQGGGSDRIGNPNGGRGAEIGGNLNLTTGEVLEIAVGGTGTGFWGGGRGGSFVVGPDKTPLVIADASGGCGFRTRRERPHRP
jgi:hypothetical protein